MIEKTFTEGISLQKEGPKSSNCSITTCNRIAEKYYCSSVYFSPKLVPKRTFYTIDETAIKSMAIYNRMCSISSDETSFESSVSLDPTASLLKFDCDLPYNQNLELEPRLTPKEYSESIFNFPPENAFAYNSSVFYDPCFTKENYIVGLKVDKIKEVTLPVGNVDSFTSSMHINVGEDIGKICLNGDCQPASLINGV